MARASPAEFATIRNFPLVAGRELFVDRGGRNSVSGLIGQFFHSDQVGGAKVVAPYTGIV